MDPIDYVKCNANSHHMKIMKSRIPLSLQSKLKDYFCSKCGELGYWTFANSDLKTFCPNCLELNKVTHIFEISHIVERVLTDSDSLIQCVNPECTGEFKFELL